MPHLVISHKILDKYLRFLAKFDIRSKKRLIEKLKESIDKEPVIKNKKQDLNSLYGAWVDDKSSDDIIIEIITSRIEKRKIENFE